ncbi:hypothetical protein NKDENANG_02194 [Candidatus Entotheonellaceae bacterium PAL068K]
MEASASGYYRGTKRDSLSPWENRAGVFQSRGWDLFVPEGLADDRHNGLRDKDFASLNSGWLHLVLLSQVQSRIRAVPLGAQADDATCEATFRCPVCRARDWKFESLSPTIYRLNHTED